MNRITGTITAVKRIRTMVTISSESGPHFFHFANLRNPEQVAKMEMDARVEFSSSPKLIGNLHNPLALDVVIL
jgi:hypothetical protein